MHTEITLNIKKAEYACVTEYIPETYNKKQ